MVEAGQTGSGKAVLRRRDGTKLVINRYSGKVEKEFSSSGKRVIRIKKNKRSKSKGNTGFSPITDQLETENSRRTQSNKDITTRNNNAIRQSNFQKQDGQLQSIRYSQTPLNNDIKPVRGQQSLFSTSKEKYPGEKSFTTFSAAPPRRKGKEAFQDFGRSFLAATGIRPQDQDGTFVSDRVRSPGASTRAERTGFLIGTPVNFLVGRAANLGFKANSALFKGFQTTRAGRAVGANQFTRFSGQLAGGTTQTVGIVEGASFIGSGSLTKSQRDQLKTPSMKAALKEARQAERASVQSQGINIGGFNVNPRGLAFELGGSVFAGKKAGAAYETSLRSSLANTDLNPYFQDQAAKAGVSRRKTRNVGEVGALLNIARFSERVGSRELGKAFKQAPLKKPTATRKAFAAAPAIGRAGFIEGFSQEVGQQRTRERKFNLLEATNMGTLGAISAATIGGVIAGGGKLSKPVRTASYTTDWYEKAGDILADSQARATRTGSSKVTTLSPGLNNNFARTPLRGNNGVLGSKGFTFTNNINTFTNKRSKSGVLSNSFSNPLAATFTNTPTSTNTNAFTNILSNPFTNTKTNTQTNTNTNTFINPFTNINVGVPTRFAAFPTVPTQGGGGFGFGSKRKKGKKGKKTPTLFNDVFGKRSGTSDKTGLGLRF